MKTFQEKIRIAAQFDNSFAPMDRVGAVIVETYRHVAGDGFEDGEWCWEFSMRHCGLKVVAKSEDAALDALLAAMRLLAIERAEKCKKDQTNSSNEERGWLKRADDLFGAFTESAVDK